MSNQKKFKAGDKVVWDDLGYCGMFFVHTNPKQILTVSHYGDEDDGEDGLVFFENLSDINGNMAGVFDHRFTLVESAQESAETPSIQGKTCSQNCVSCKDKETPVLEENDENGWFKRGELPPVGANIEYKIGAGPWFEATVKYVLDVLGGEEDEIVIACPHLGFEQLLTLSDHAKIRPTATPEQIAEQEREAYCDRIYSVLCKAERKNNRSDMAESLYDAGLRFVEKGE